MASASSQDTIAAVATAPGGAIAVIRISGADALQVAARVWRGRSTLGLANVRRMLLGHLIDPHSAELLDQAMAVYMRGPHSFTGEDVVELQCHGGLMAARLALRGCLAAGARSAEPGEFTRRAFLNGKMDLTQAEAVMDVIGAHTEMAMQVATRQLDGRLGRQVQALHADLSDLLAETEVRMDFVEEDLEWTSPEGMSQRIDHARAAIARLLLSRREGEVLRSGVAIAIGGPPNAGKSSFLNLVLGRERAIVTDIPGTTRDTLEEYAHIRAIPVRLTDTAGIREATDLVERSGIERSRTALRQARIILWFMDLTRPLAEQLPQPALVAGRSLVAVLNKADAADQDLEPGLLPGAVQVKLSVHSGQGIEALYDIIESLVWDHPHEESPDVAVNERHAGHLDQARARLEAARSRILSQDWELAAVDLRGALEELGQIIGLSVIPDILQTIFGRYCIGK